MTIAAAAATCRSRSGDKARFRIEDTLANLATRTGWGRVRGLVDGTKCVLVPTGRAQRTTSRQTPVWLVQVIAVLVALAGMAGCGSTKSRTASEQLLMSDAVDRAVSQIDFRDMAGQKVFFETKYLVNTRDPLFPANQKGLGFVNAEYIISSLRQQMVTADLRLQDKVDDADFVVEARIGAVGFDSTEVVYGIPASAPLSSAATTISGTPVPTIPEISFARKNIQLGAAKVGVFAYDRRTRTPVWQSGIAQAVSDARDSWLFGVGPFQDGSIYKGTQFEGRRMRDPGIAKLPPLDREFEQRAASFLHDASTGSAHRNESDRFLTRPDDSKADPAVKPASGGAKNVNSGETNTTVANPPGTNPPGTTNPSSKSLEAPANSATKSEENSNASLRTEASPAPESAIVPAPLMPRTSGWRATSADVDVSHELASDAISASWRSLLDSARVNPRDLDIERILDRSFASAPMLLGPIGLSNAWPADGSSESNANAAEMSETQTGTGTSGSIIRRTDESLAGSKFESVSGDGQSGAAWHAPQDAGQLRFPFPLELPDTVGKSWPLRSKRRSL